MSCHGDSLEERMGVGGKVHFLVHSSKPGLHVCTTHLPNFTVNYLTGANW